MYFIIEKGTRAWDHFSSLLVILLAFPFIYSLFFLSSKTAFSSVILGKQYIYKSFMFWVNDEQFLSTEYL